MWGKKEGRQLILAKHLLRADWFIHILMYSLHDNPAISFSLQMKKPRLREVQSSVYGHTGPMWQNEDFVWVCHTPGGPCFSYCSWLPPGYSGTSKVRGTEGRQWNQAFPDLSPFAVGARKGKGTDSGCP